MQVPGEKKISESEEKDRQANYRASLADRKLSMSMIPIEPNAVWKNHPSHLNVPNLGPIQKMPAFSSGRPLFTNYSMARGQIINASAVYEKKF